MKKIAAGNKVYEKALRIFQTNKARGGFSFLDLEDGEEITFNSKLQFPTASVIKVPILYTAMRMVDRKKLNLNLYAGLSKFRETGGSSLIKILDRKAKLTVKDSLYLMIILSDNAATNYFIDKISMTAVNREMNRLGIKKTRLCRRMMDFKTRLKGIDNYMTAREMNLLMQVIWNGRGLSPEARFMALDILHNQLYKNYLGHLLPSNVSVYSKSGSLDDVIADTAIVEIKGKLFILTAAQNQFDDFLQAKIRMNRLAELLFKYFVKKHRIKTEK